MHNHWLFIYNVLTHLVASMSGLASFAFSLWEHVHHKKLESRVFFIVGFLCLAVAFDQAWQDEHRNAQLLISQKSDAVSEMNFWKDQTYKKDGDLRSLNELLVKNYTALTGEQATANGSQAALANLSSKILELDKPVGQKTTILFLDHGDKEATKPTVRYLLLTNNEVASPSLDVQCNRSLDHAYLLELGGVVGWGEPEQRIASNYLREGISTPAWTVNRPIVVTIEYEGESKDVACLFK